MYRKTGKESDIMYKEAKARYMRYLEESGGAEEFARRLDKLGVKSVNSENPQNLVRSIKSRFSNTGDILSSEDGVADINNILRGYSKTYGKIPENRMQDGKKLIWNNFDMSSNNGAFKKLNQTEKAIKSNKAVNNFGKMIPGIAGKALFAGAAAYGGKKLYDIAKENRKEKTAFEVIDDTFEKIAATTKDVMSTQKIKTGQKRKLGAPERFTGTTKTKIRPMMDDYGVDLTYNVKTTGPGNKNQFLEADTDLIDVVRARKSESEAKEYDSRMERPINRLRKADSLRYKLPAALGTASGALMFGTGLKYPMTASDRIYSSFGAGTLGLLAGTLAHGAVNSRAQKKLIKSLTDDEKAVLVDAKDRYGAAQTKNISNASKVIGKNYYHYYV